MDDAREREKHLAQAQEIANVGSWELHLLEGTLDWSAECHRIFGIPEDVEVTYERFLERVHPEDRAHVQDEWDAALDGVPYDVEHRIVVDGETKWVREKGELEFDDSGRALTGVGVVKDITEAKAREREVRAQKQRYSSLFDSIQDAILVVDSDRRIVDGNSAFSTLFGYDVAEIEGESVSYIYAETDEFEAVGETLETKSHNDTVSTTIRCQKKSGQVFPAEVTIFDRNARDVEGGFVGLIRDISDREDRLQQMKVIDRVLRHNLRNDLNIIQGSAEMIDDAGPASDAEKIVETSEKLLRTASKWRRITSFLSSPPPNEAIDVVPIVETVVSRVESQHPDADISVDCPVQCRVVSTPAIQRAIRELLENAVVHSTRDVPSVDVEIDPGGLTTTIRVADDGDPIPEMERNVLSWDEDIEPLYHGSGMGLWLVTLIVRHSDGVLTFDENEPHGNVVTICLPSP